MCDSTESKMKHSPADTQKAKPSHGENLGSTVLAGGYCVGCGACAATTRTIEMDLTTLGMYQARIKSDCDPLTLLEATKVCPFSANATDETTIARELFGASCVWHEEIGFYNKTYAGYVVEGEFRSQGSSGGMGTWVVSELVKQGLVDAVIHVRPLDGAVSQEGSVLFGFSISRTPEELLDGAKSRYYPVHMAEVINQVRQAPSLRYAIVGLPCFLKAVRLLAQQDPILRKAIVYHVGLVCGHLKSAAFGELLAWQVGIDPGRLQSINFREKLPGRKAGRYGFRATDRVSGEDRVKPMADVFGGDWGLGLFKYKACEYCDDVVAETADIAIGDAWLPQYDDDYRGTNVVVVRNSRISELIAAAIDEGRLAMNLVGADDVAQSQRAGLRHRREGLSARLSDAIARGVWFPPKRVVPNSRDVSPRRRAIYRLREQIAAASHEAFLVAKGSGDISLFFGRLKPQLVEYAGLMRSGIAERVKERIAVTARKIRRAIFRR